MLLHPSTHSCPSQGMRLPPTFWRRLGMLVRPLQGTPPLASTGPVDPVLLEQGFGDGVVLDAQGLLGGGAGLHIATLVWAPLSFSFLPHNLLQLGDLPQQVEELLLSIGGYHPLVVGAKGLTVGLDGGHGGVREQDIGPLLPVAVVGPTDQALVLEGAGDGRDQAPWAVSAPRTMSAG